MKNKVKELINEIKNTLTFKFWLYFVLFAVALFIILWFMQVIFLQSYYSSMKKREVQRLANNIEEEYKTGEYEEYIDNVAYKNASSIFIFDLNGNQIYSSSNLSGQGNIAQMPTRPISIDTTGIVDKILGSPLKKVSYTLQVNRFKTELYVYGKVIPNTEACLVIVASIDPIDATTSVLQSQLLYVTMIALLVASILSIFISKRLSRPIRKITQTANKLANGNYDITFEKAGYTEIDELVDTLNFATRELGKTDKMKKELIANVSHDLRTPLTMIKAYSEMIRDLSGDNKEKREEHLNVIISETDRLTTLVNDMMDLSKIESGLMSLHKEIFNLTDMINSILERFKTLNENEDCKFVIEIQDNIYVLADKSKIQQVLYNLISNAINHGGDKKEIKIKVVVQSKRVKVMVIDNGVGIPKEEIPHIWSRYYRVDKSFKRPSSGSGLGLSIVKNILDIHKSNYGVDSETGKGSTFWFDLEKVNKKDIKEEKVK